MASVQYTEVFKQKICSEAEALVRDFFPRKIAELDAMLQEEDFSLANLAKIRTSTAATLKGAQDSGDSDSEKKTFDTNSHIVNLIDRIKPEIWSLLDAINTLRMWVILLIPKIEDGNNFGVEVQEETLGELKAIEQELAGNEEQIAAYFLSRGKVMGKVVKRPGIEDYNRFIAEEDEKQFVSLRQMIDPRAMMRLMARSSTPSQFYPKLLGTIVVAGVLACTLVHFAPAQPRGSLKVIDSNTEGIEAPSKKTLMRREKKRPPVALGPLLRREEEPTASFMSEQASQLLRLMFLTLFASVAVVGFATQAKGALMQLMGLSDVQKFLGLKENK